MSASISCVLRILGDLCGLTWSKCDESDPETPSTLFSLPNEVLDMIVDHLDTPDTACFLLTSRSLRYNYGIDIWRGLDLSHECEATRCKYLLTLSRDYPKYYLCHTCSYLHPVAWIGLPRLDFRYPYVRNKCVNNISIKNIPVDCFITHTRQELYRLTFQHVQLAMCRHRQGKPYGISLRRLATKEVQARPGSGSVTLLSVDPKIIMNVLYLRVQQWIMLDDHGLWNVKAAWCLSICAHSRDTYHGSPRWQLLTCKLQHRDRVPGCPTCPPLLRCATCHVEFKMELKTCGSKRALVLTKWLNMGRGEHPRDSDWWKHLYRPGSRDPNFTAVKDRKGVCYLYELFAGKSMDVLTEENASLLLNDAYRTRLTPLRYRQNMWAVQSDCQIGDVVIKN